MEMQAVSCPKCLAYVKSPKALLEGNRVRCPNCKLLFAADGSPQEGLPSTVSNEKLPESRDEIKSKQVDAKKVAAAHKSVAAVKGDDAADAENTRWSWLGRKFKRSMAVMAGCLLVGLTVAWAVHFLKGKQWLIVQKDDNGYISELEVKKELVPRDVLALLSNSKKTAVPGKEVIQQMARDNRLFDAWETNPHLCFVEGDIVWWSEQKRPVCEVEMEFLARKLLLEAADKGKVKIKDHGTLSFWCERISRFLSRKWDQQLHATHTP
jgi:hypothetical protein